MQATPLINPFPFRRAFGCALVLLCLCASFAQAHPAWGIVVAREGTIYFADTERDRIWMLTTNGRLKAIIRKEHTHGLFLAADGFLYGESVALDTKSTRWLSSRWRAHSDDFFEEILAPTANPPAGWGICRDAQGNTYDIEQSDQLARVMKRTPDGQTSVLAGDALGEADGLGINARFRSLTAITLGPDNALYVRDGNQLRRVTLAGEVSTLGSDTPVRNEAHPASHNTLSLTIDEQGNFYVVDLAARNIRRIRPGQRSETVWQSDWLWTPTGVAVRDGNLYVLENLAPTAWAAFGKLGMGPYLRVFRVSADGTTIKLTSVWGTTTSKVLGVLVLALAVFSLLRLRRRDRLA